MSTNSYYLQDKSKAIVQLRNITKQLPPFVDEYLRNASNISSHRTKLAYAYDLKVFFHYINAHCIPLKDKPLIDYTYADLGKISVDDIEEFIDYITYYENQDQDKAYFNNEKGKARKLSAIRSMYKYFYKKRKIAENPVDFVDNPKIHDKNIVRLNAGEVANLIDIVDHGNQLTKHQQRFHKRTRNRDLAIICLLLGTGIRVSECVGINKSDIDFDESGVKILRKGGNESIVYFGDEVFLAMQVYNDSRQQMKPCAGHEDAFFLSLQNKRITVRAVQNLVKKYANSLSGIKDISPHKLRSTYGTALYKETGDIYLVADVLGHKDVNTTRKHYAQMEDDRRRQASKYVKLRES